MWTINESDRTHNQEHVEMIVTAGFCPVNILGSLAVAFGGRSASPTESTADFGPRAECRERRPVGPSGPALRDKLTTQDKTRE
jgi:hypothetical protein